LPAAIAVVAGERLGELWCAGDEVEGFDLTQAHPVQPGECAVEVVGELVLDRVELDGESGLVHGPDFTARSDP
jgi:hypothetical protein